MKQILIRTIHTEKELIRLVGQNGFRHVLLVSGTHHSLPALESYIRGKANQFLQVTPPHGLLNLAAMQKILDTHEWQPDLLIALGGGRIMDAAKILVHQHSAHRPYFVAIPTTAGSGSEATPFAVAYEGKQKISLQSESLLPDVAMLDITFLKSLSSRQRAISGIDALSQSIESLWNIHATDESRSYATGALELVWNTIEAFVKGGDEISDTIMQDAAYKAGQAIAITRTTGCHALSYYLTAHHNVPHGQAVGLFLPAFFMYNDQAGSKVKWQKIFQLMGVNSSSEAFARVSSLMKSCGLANRFSDLHLEVDVEALLDSVNEERFANNPVPFDRDALRELIKNYIV